MSNFAALHAVVFPLFTKHLRMRISAPPIGARVKILTQGHDIFTRKIDYASLPRLPSFVFLTFLGAEIAAARNAPPP